MTDEDRRSGSEGTEDNARDESNEAAGKGKDATRKAVEEEENTGGGGSGTKDSVGDDLDKTQRR